MFSEFMWFGNLSGAFREWRPHMDLLAVFPSGSRAISLPIWRLSNERQSGSPPLFTEKLPYAVRLLGLVTKIQRAGHRYATVNRVADCS